MGDIAILANRSNAANVSSCLYFLAALSNKVDVERKVNVGKAKKKHAQVRSMESIIFSTY